MLGGLAAALAAASGLLAHQLSQRSRELRATRSELQGRRQDVETLTSESSHLRGQFEALRADLAQQRAQGGASEERARLETSRADALEERYRPIVDVEREAQCLQAALEDERTRRARELEAGRQDALAQQQALQNQVEAIRLQTDQEAAAHRAQLAGYVESERARVTRELDALRADTDAQGRVIAATVTTAQSQAAVEIATAQHDARRAVAGARDQAETEVLAFTSRRNLLRDEIRGLEDQATSLRVLVGELDDAATFQSFGYYQKRYQFGTSAQYERLLEQVCNEQKVMVKAKAAATCHVEWLVNGSKTEGRKQITQTLRLMLRAFNGETDAAIAKVTYKNAVVMEARIRKAYETIKGLTGVQQCRIAPAYLDLRLQELVLVHEHCEKLHEEREEQRRIRERMRDEEIAQRQIEKARAEAEEDERQYQEALDKARREVEQAHGLKQERLAAKVTELQRRLEEAQANKERAVARAQLTRSGHVYIISNLGSFGEHVYKIGMTRRLDPLERIRELGDASVPFEFDIHAVIFAEDAPTLEAELHRAFADRRVNRVNERKEFFKVGIDELAAEVRKHRGEITFTMAAEAEDYRKTLAAIAELESISSLPV